MYVIVEEDLVICKTYSNNYENCIELPREFEDKELDEIRYMDQKIVDVTTRHEFYIDEFGEKHIQQDSNNSRQLLKCKWNDPLEQDENGIWKIKE